MTAMEHVKHYRTIFSRHDLERPFIASLTLFHKASACKRSRAIRLVYGTAMRCDTRCVCNWWAVHASAETSPDPLAGPERPELLQAGAMSDDWLWSRF
jgi:hypothetical protein